MFLEDHGLPRHKGKAGRVFCSGDSGGPLFLPDQQTIVAVTSFSSKSRITGLCTQPLYYQRVDLPRVLKWVRSFP